MGEGFEIQWQPAQTNMKNLWAPVGRLFVVITGERYRLVLDGVVMCVIEVPPPLKKGPLHRGVIEFLQGHPVSGPLMAMYYHE